MSLEESYVHADERETEHLVLQLELGIVVGDADVVCERRQVIVDSSRVVIDYALPDARELALATRHCLLCNRPKTCHTQHKLKDSPRATTCSACVPQDESGKKPRLQAVDLRLAQQM